MREILDEFPLIAAVRNEEGFESALESPCKVIFLLYSDINTVASYLSRAREFNKTVFVHIDFCEGLGKDLSGMKFLKAAGAHGIIATKNQLINYAAQCGLKSVQRFFIIDSQSVATAFDSIRHSFPDLIEIMPGIMPGVIKRFESCKVPLIAGGLIQTKKDIVSALEAGASAVSTAKSSLWYM